MPHARRDLIRETFGNRLKHAREAAGFATATDFAAALGIDAYRYRHYERGRSEPDFEILLRMCAILQTTPDFLLLGKIGGKSDT